MNISVFALQSCLTEITAEELLIPTGLPAPSVNIIVFFASYKILMYWSPGGSQSKAPDSAHAVF